MEEDSRTPSLPRRIPKASAIQAPPPVKPPALPRRQPGASGRQVAATTARTRPPAPPVPNDDETPTQPQPAIRLPVATAAEPAPVGIPAAEPAPVSTPAAKPPTIRAPATEAAVVSEPAAASRAAASRAGGAAAAIAGRRIAAESGPVAPPRPAPPRPPPARPAEPRPRPAPERGSRPRKPLLRRRWVLGGLVIAMAGASVAGTWVFGLASRDGTHPAARAGGATAFEAEARARAAAAAWVVREVSKTAMVSCDPSMCLALEARGKPSSTLLAERPASQSPLHSAVIVATAALRSEFGSRLDAQYAPVVLASFGRGELRVDVRIIASQGAAAYESAMRADQVQRKATGVVLLRSHRVQGPAAVQSQLGTGLVDARLLITLTALAARQQVRIDSFGAGGPGASSTVPLRSADLSEAGRPASAQASDLKWVLSYLQTQRGQYAGATAQLVRPASTGSQAVLRIAFTAPSPLGLLGPQAP
jgi:hypothetical protein